jgi:hypothetical protein
LAINDRPSMTGNGQAPPAEKICYPRDSGTVDRGHYPLFADA